MNIKYINPLLESTIAVLSTMAMIEPKPGTPSLKTEINALGDITGLIDLAGGSTRGSLAVSFSKSAILDITARMLGETVHSIDATVIDIVGEITNMITGNAKRLFSEQGMEFDLTLPSTMVGQDRPLQHSVSGNPILLPFTTTAGEIYVEFCFC